MTARSKLRSQARRAAIATFIFNAHFAAAGPTLGPCEREMARAAQLENIPLSVLYSVGLTETGHGGRLQPFAMNIDGAAVNPQTLAEAMAVFEQARRRGAKFIDIGCMQINHRFHGGDFPSVEAMFDPHRNVTYAAHFLKQLRARQPSWTVAVARYNAGPDNDAGQRKYVCAVIANMVRAGLGGWTDNARRFCGPGGA